MQGSQIRGLKQIASCMEREALVGCGAAYLLVPWAKLLQCQQLKGQSGRSSKTRRIQPGHYLAQEST